MKYIFLGVVAILFYNIAFAQHSFNYEIRLDPVNIPNLPGLHSYAFAQDNGKWLIIGGRKDGIHARQPFNTFPESSNNTDIYVVDVKTMQFWSAPIKTLAASLEEQLQSTNMNFYQDEDTLYIIGGYAYSSSANDHITFPNLTTINVSAVINAIINGTSIQPYLKQISDTIFAVTGGRLGKIGETFYLVGGQKFTGRYNPMNHPTFSQEYTNQIRKFSVNNSGSQLSYSNYSAITDPIHLRRRDYNLLPQIFPDGSEGLLISSGVFQLNADLPFLYPVEITASGYLPVTSFNQYLSNYHSATASLYDSTVNQMHMLFFGGMSQYYYDNGNLIQDDNVPFVKTISRVTRFADGSFQEFILPVEMPALKGSGAEFILNQQVPHSPSEIIQLDKINSDTIIIGHIYGGILSPLLNPFSTNQTTVTSADASIYSVKLIRTTPTAVDEINGKNPYFLEIFPNPVKNEINLRYELSTDVHTEYFITNTKGQIIEEGIIIDQLIGENNVIISFGNKVTPQTYFVTVVFDNKFFITKQIIKR